MLGSVPDPHVHPMKLSTQRLEVVLQTREEVERMIEAMSEYDRAQISADWLARFRASDTDATEAAQALIDYATACGEVRLIRAHTLPEGVASMRVLEKCGFRFVGETVDPEDGTVSRFERSVGDSADTT